MVGGALAILALIMCCGAPAPCQETQWLPTRGTHAWARFGLRAWKEVRIRSSVFDDNELVVRSSTTVARTHVVRVARRSFSLCVATTVKVAGQEYSADPKEITKELAPEVESSKIVGSDTVTINGQTYPTQVIELVTKSGTKREVSSLYFCGTTTPNTLKRITKSTDTQTPGVITSTTVTVTGLNQQMDILSETLCTWAVTTVIERAERVVTIREVHCRDVPGELVSQVTEQRNAEGKLVSRKELDLVGYGTGRVRRRHRRSR